VSASNTPANHFGGSFGPNEWLVDEMYERYQQDPSSVDKAWWDFFADYTPPTQSTTSNGSVATPVAGTPPIPKSSTLTTPPVVPTATQVVVTQPAAPVALVAPVVPAAPAVPKPTSVVQAPQASTSAMPADPIVKPIPTLVTPSASTLEPIRGVAARVVQSMEASLTVPTATSVRAIPAKLMIDNRTVINNHLARGRGGKVSFTHLIGYAMIKALRAMPEMNTFFAEQDGKPVLGRPEHINLGIAIDLAKPDGTRQLLVPSIKGCEALDFGQFWASYEETVRKARSGTLTVEDYAGTTVSLTNPGTLGTVHSVPRLVQGQGLILGVGARITLPNSKARAKRPSPTWRFQRLLRSPAPMTTALSKVHNPAISCAASTRSCWALSTSTTRSLLRYVFLTSQFAGPLISNSQKMIRSARPLVFNN